MKPTENVCLSGGAVGADTAWQEAAVRHGHRPIAFTFAGGKGSKHNPYRCVLTEEQLVLADPWLHRANQRLERKFPSLSHDTNSLLRRNFYQVKDSTAVYAIAGLDGSSVYGGTAWAVEMFKLLHPNSDAIYVYDESKKSWFQWNHLNWTEITRPPRPSGMWTGIGTREIEESSIDIINKVFT